MTFELSLEEGRFLVKIARDAAEEYILHGRKIDPPHDASPKMRQKCGVFVTLTKLKDGRRELRGCIGFPYPIYPLVEAVIEAAINSSTKDPRFPPVGGTELDEIFFEVSVLTPPEKLVAKKAIDYPSKILIGRDGLIVKRGYNVGLLLPQVPVEWGWDSEEFLCQCCFKAGLPPDSWLLNGTEISTFKAIIFEEESPRGEVVRKDLARKK